MEEQRKVPRWPINAAAGLLVDGGVKPLACKVEDISTQGMRVSFKKNLFAEAFSNFNLILSDKIALDLSAQVAWQGEVNDRNTFGLTFNQLDELAKNRIAGYVKTCYPEIMLKQWWG